MPKVLRHFNKKFYSEFVFIVSNKTIRLTRRAAHGRAGPVTPWKMSHLSSVIDLPGIQDLINNLSSVLSP